MEDYRLPKYFAISVLGGLCIGVFLRLYYVDKDLQNEAKQLLRQEIRKRIVQKYEGPNGLLTNAQSSNKTNNNQQPSKEDSQL